jgi:hypothetical protein
LLVPATHGMNGDATMTLYPVLFNLTPLRLRRSGARGGRAAARNRRLRQRAAGIPAHTPLSEPLLPLETTAQAMATLEAQFPWLRPLQKRSPLG